MWRIPTLNWDSRFVNYMYENFQCEITSRLRYCLGYCLGYNAGCQRFAHLVDV